MSRPPSRSARSRSTRWRTRAGRTAGSGSGWWTERMTRDTSVAIVGLGSRGLSVLERVVTLAKLAGPEAGRVRVEVIDPACDGSGVHDTGQPDYLLLNTTCSHVSMFPDANSVAEDVDAPGPSLYDWVLDRRLRMAEDGFTVGSSGRAIRPTDFL